MRRRLQFLVNDLKKESLPTKFLIGSAGVTAYLLYVVITAEILDSIGIN